ncbi:MULTISPECIES: hypothetical protein [Polyangium]|uniref:Uncharacterized protein n=2 Tax=Polyangium TaxID=55 RepID=A0ABT6NP39_9BACT|nr:MULTISPECIES: hypothetical protein [Polyangium]MDC0743260.1 hypothetical protein [Polyangium mundeleinium]MDI1429977.1 hypothetical protein [Polyangium sorediatum]
MFAVQLRTKLFVSIALGASGLGSALVVNGCTAEPLHSTLYCLPDASPDADIHGDCFPDGGGSIEPLSCKAAGGECVPMGTSDFREKAVLVWMGAEEEAPDCPERAEGDFYTGYADLSVHVQCSPCACGPATCSLPNAITVDSASFCQGGNVTSYQAPMPWDGSCVSPAVIPSGTFASIMLAAPTVSPCEPIGDPIPESPSFAPQPVSFANGIHWGTFAKACQGTVDGKCENSNDTCLPSAEPPPPGFRQCVQYTLPVDEEHLPKCPEVFPHQFVFYGGTEGKVECSACECGEPIGGQCAAAVSAYQNPVCGSLPNPLFKDVPAAQGLCIDFAGMPLALGGMEAKWINNEPGTCEPSGGQPVGEVRGADPRVFCCQAPSPPMDQ